MEVEERVKFKGVIVQQLGDEIQRFARAVSGKRKPEDIEMSLDDFFLIVRGFVERYEVLGYGPAAKARIAEIDAGRK